MSDTTRIDFITALRDCANFLEQHPEVPVPIYSTLCAAVDKKDEIVAAARATSWQKDYSDDYFTLKKTFGTNLTLLITTAREKVCRKIVKGTKVIPASEAQIVEDVEWVCDEPLLAGEQR